MSFWRNVLIILLLDKKKHHGDKCRISSDGICACRVSNDWNERYVDIPINDMRLKLYDVSIKNCRLDCLIKQSTLAQLFGGKLTFLVDDFSPFGRHRVIHRKPDAV
jgi:hypothetical protein